VYRPRHWALALQKSYPRRPDQIVEDEPQTASSIGRSSKPQGVLPCCAKSEGQCLQLEDRLSDRDLAAGAKHDHIPVGILRAQNEQFGSEARDILRAEIADTDDERADQRLRFVVGDLSARSHGSFGSDVDAYLVGRIARPGKGFDLDDPANPDVETGEVVVGSLGL